MPEPPGRVYVAKPLVDSRGKAHEAPVILRHINIVWIRVSTPLKNTTPSFLPSPPPLKSANSNCPSTPFLDNPPLYIGFSLKFGFFIEHPKYQSFSFLTSSYHSKETKFLVKISQFECLVMTEKNIFVYKLLLSLNISDFSFFFL